VLCVEFILVTATVDIVQCYCVVLYVILVTATVDVLQWYCVVLEYIVVTASVDIVRNYSVVCGDYCGYSKSRFSAMVLRFVEFIVVTATGCIVQWYCVLLQVIVVTATVGIVQWYCVVCGVYFG